MKKIISFAVTAISVIILCTVSAFASNKVTDIDINAVLYEDGSATVIQVWQGTFSEGTECYLPFRTDKNVHLSDFTVSDGTTEFTYVDNWYIDASFDEKAYKCGLNPTSDGVEMCWGISEYGSNTYTFSYRVSGVVGSYTDSDGFNFQFLNSGLNFTPTNVKLTVSAADGTPLTADNCGIWAFGYEGYVNFSGGNIVINTTEPIDEYNYITLLARFDKGIFSPSVSFDKSFETLRNKAFEGSDYTEKAKIDPELILAILFVIVFVSIVLCGIISNIIKKVKINRFIKEVDYFRNLPCNDNMDMTYALGRAFSLCDDTNVVGAYLLKLMSNGNVQSVSQTETGAFGRETESAVIKLIKAPEDVSSNLYTLYDMLSQAAGSDDTLTPDEAESFCKKKYKVMRKLINDFESDGNAVIRTSDCFVGNRISSKMSKLTANGNKYLSEIAGFKKYMLDFSLIDERKVAEVDIWREYLVYAQLLGIADTVADQLKKLIPEKTPEIESFDRDVVISRSFNRHMYRTMYRSEMAARKRMSGGGGRASFGGGGGFSGGGFGGGTR